MRHWLPFPLAWLFLLGLWLLLNQTLAVGHVILGALVALGATHAFALLDPPPTLLRRPVTMLRLTALVLADIVRSNIAVGRIIIYPGTRKQTSGFVDIPLELRNPAALVVLACIITATPGTTWARYDSGRGILTMHILDLVDDESWVRTIKDRYERRLLEIFE
jgi:multicomponent K+:H+ antiporter subunit E